MTKGKKVSQTQSRTWLTACCAASFWLVGVGAIAAAELEATSVASSQGIQPVPASQLEIPDLPGLGSPSAYLPSAGTSHLVLDLSDRRVYVHQGDQVVASYPVAVGKRGWETPVGEHRIIQMIENPAWSNPFRGGVVAPGPNNPLGLRWIGFWTNGKNFIGFHGTPTVNSIGRAASHGCVRMHNRDVLALFEQVEMGTRVVVVP